MAKQATFEVTTLEKDGSTKTTTVSGTSDMVAGMVVMGTTMRAENRGATVTEVRRSN
jgi:ATP phosphoribosyltransferase